MWRSKITHTHHSHQTRYSNFTARIFVRAMKKNIWWNTARFWFKDKSLLVALRIGTYTQQINSYYIQTKIFSSFGDISWHLKLADIFFNLLNLIGSENQMLWFWSNWIELYQGLNGSSGNKVCTVRNRADESKAFWVCCACCRTLRDVEYNISIWVTITDKEKRQSHILHDSVLILVDSSEMVSAKAPMNFVIHVILVASPNCGWTLLFLYELWHIEPIYKSHRLIIAFLHIHLEITYSERFASNMDF